MKQNTPSLAKSTMRTAVGISAALLSLSTAASAETILVDFSDVMGSAGPNWNVAVGDSFNLTDMVDSDGNATGIDLTFSAVDDDSGGG